MLTLTNPLTIEGLTVYHDDGNEVDAVQARIDATLAAETARIQAIDDAAEGRGTSAATPPPRDLTPLPSKRFYVLPGQPSLALDPAGKPIFSLIVYRRDDARIDPDKVPKDDVGGGILTFTVELAVPAETLTKIRARLRTLMYGSTDDDTQDVDLSVVEFIEGKVSIAVAGEGTGEAGTFVKGAVGTGKVSGTGDNRKSVMVNLTQDGAALMSQLEHVRTLPINLQYELTYEHRLLGVTMRVWCDVTSSYHLVQEQQLHLKHDSGYLSSSDDYNREVSKATEVMIRNKTAGVEVVPYSSLVDNDTLLSLEKLGQDMLSKEMEKVVEAKPLPADLNRAWIESYSSDASNQLNFSLDRRMVLTRSYDPSANISNIFQENTFADLVTFVDLRTAFFSLLKVPIQVNADFSRLPISSVVVTIAYRSRKPGSTEQEERVESFDFTDGATVKTFVAYANSLDEVTYDYTAVVHYKDSQEPFTLQKSGVQDRFLVVDVGTLGMIAVDIGLGLVDLDAFPTANVGVRYRSHATGRVVEQTFTLSKEKQSILWTDLIREQSSGTYEYKTDWLRKEDHAILVGEWQSSSSLRLRVDAPVVDHLTVSAVCSGNFKDDRDQIAHVVVSLRYSDPDNDYVAEGRLDFTDDKQLLTWTVDLRNRALRDYQYRYSIIYKGGVVKHVPEDETSWLAGEPGFITVGEKYGLEVNVYPYLLQFGDRDRVVQVDLRYNDAEHGIETTGSYVFNKDNAKPQIWRVRTDPAGPKTYSVDVTYFAATGAVLRLPSRVTDADAVLAPAVPPPEPPHA